MPFEWVGDFSPPLEARPEDLRWGAFVRGFALAMIEHEPRLRFRLRGLPQGVLDTEVSKGLSGPQDGQRVVARQPVQLDSNDLPKALRSRLDVPKEGSFWVRNYYCQDCLDPRTGKPGLWVPHIRRKLHKDHNVKDGDITSKGLKTTWTPNHQIFTGSPERLHARLRLMYAVALTSIPKDPALLEGYDSIALLPIRALERGAPPVPDPEAARKAVAKALPDTEHVVVLPPTKQGGIEAFLAFLQRLDSAALDPLDGDELPDADDQELKDQISRDNAARQVIGAAQQSVKEGAGAANAVASATSGKSTLR